VRFVTERLLDDGPQLMPAYTTTGGRVADQRSLCLRGYPSGTDVVGNWVNRQFQHDAFGESLLLAAAARHDHIDADAWRAAEITVAAIERRWREPDAAIWELEADHWTHSCLICAAGSRAIAACQPTPPAAAGLALDDAIVAETAAAAVHPQGRWQRSPTDDRIDAALLLPAICEGRAPEDPRSLATLAAVQRELTAGAYSYRYRPHARPLGKAEGAFLLCGFCRPWPGHNKETTCGRPAGVGATAPPVARPV
jgi:GH15 family glucan-1,4-alpha-glucosidase